MKASPDYLVERIAAKVASTIAPSAEQEAGQLSVQSERDPVIVPTQKLEKTILRLEGGNMDGSRIRAAWQAK